jgi:outer membrane autotransporter protein
LYGRTPAQLGQFLTQLEPNMVLNTEALLNSVVAVNGGATTSINNRLIAARATSGMSAGDEVGRGFEVWAQPFGSFLTQDATQGVNGFTANTYGAAIGADTMVRPDLRLGLALGFGNSNVNYDGTISGNTASLWNAQLALYGTWFRDGFFLDGLLGGGLNWYSTQENISLLGLSRSANFNGTQFNARLGAGYDWTASNGMIVTPGLSVQETHLGVDGYTTSGAGVLNLHVNSDSTDIIQSRLGARVAYPLTGYGTYTLTPEVHAYYVHNFGSDQTTATSTFTGGGPAFTTTAPARDRDIFNLGLGLTVAQVGPLALSGVYDYSGGATSHEQTFYFRFKTDF